MKIKFSDPIQAGAIMAILLAGVVYLIYKIC